MRFVNLPDYLRKIEKGFFLPSGFLALALRALVARWRGDSRTCCRSTYQSRRSHRQTALSLRLNSFFPPIFLKTLRNICNFVTRLKIKTKIPKFEVRGCQIYFNSEQLFFVVDGGMMVEWTEHFCNQAILEGKDILRKALLTRGANQQWKKLLAGPF